MHTAGRPYLIHPSNFKYNYNQLESFFVWKHCIFCKVGQVRPRCYGHVSSLSPTNYWFIILRGKRFFPIFIRERLRDGPGPNWKILKHSLWHCIFNQRNLYCADTVPELFRVTFMDFGIQISTHLHYPSLSINVGNQNHFYSHEKLQGMSPPSQTVPTLLQFQW